MTTLHETAYPSLKPDPTPRELAELYTPTKDEQLLAAGIGKRALPRMAALIHLKVFQRLGYFISLAEVPPVIREHIAQQVGVVRPPRSEEHTSELQSQSNLVCRLLLEKKNKEDKQ